ncbi:TPA: hypothetical protein ACH3X3_006500, partial [Trebouxia sp. C0006]
MTSPAQAKAEDPPKDVEPPGQPAATETGNRGGEASTSASGPSLAEPTGNDHTAKWKVYTSLAKKLVAQRKLVEAEKYLKQALAEAKQGFGEDDPHVAGACNNLAELHRLKKDFHAAEVLYQESVDKMRRCFGDGDIRVGAALHNMAGLYMSMDPPDLDRAEGVFRQALDVKRRAVGEKHAEYVQTLVALAELKRRQGSTADALLLFKESADVLQHQDPTFSASNVLQYTQLASVLMGAGQLGEAEALLNQLLLHVETVKGADHTDVGLICQETAVLMERTKRLPQARDLLQRALDIRAAKYKDALHPALVDPLLALAAVELKQSDTASWQRAFNIASRARDIIQGNVKALESRFALAKKVESRLATAPGWPTTSFIGRTLLSFFPPKALDPKDDAKVNLAFLLTSAKLATALRLMSHAERNLKRDQEAEETLVTAMRIFGGSHIRTCLESMYADTDDTMESDLGSAVAINVKTSVVKRVLESYAACSVHLAELVKKREDRNEHGDDAADVAALQNGARELRARAVAAH